MHQYLYVVLGLGLVGCGTQPPAFTEKPVVPMNFTVEGGATEAVDEEQAPVPPAEDVDAILSELENEASDDAVAGDQPGNGEVASNDGGGASSGGSTDKGVAGKGDDWVSPDISRPSSGEMKACARMAGVAESRLKIAGNQRDVTLGATDILVAKITGNQNKLVLNFNGDAQTKLAGICLFLAGNQAEAEINTNLTIGRIFYTARGNQSQGRIAVNEPGDVEEMIVDLSGNQAALSVSGVTECPSARLKGHDVSFQCAPR